MKKAGLVFLSVLLAGMIFSACELVITEGEVQLKIATYDITGKVVNAEVSPSETGKNYYDGLVDATISLTKVNEDGTLATTGVVTDTVSSTGSYSLLDVENGLYQLTGTSTTHTFVPMYVEITGSNTEMPDLIAYANAESQYDFYVLLQWDNTDYDLDFKMTYPTSPTERSTISYLPTETTATSVNTSNNSSATFALSRDVTAPIDGSNYTATPLEEPRVETISIKGATGNGWPYFTTGESNTGVPQDQLRFYIEAWGRKDGSTLNSNPDDVAITGLVDATDPIPSADARVFVMQGNELYGQWSMPFNTNERILHVATIMYESGYDPAIFSAGNVSAINAEQTQIRGIGGTDTPIVIIQR